jgi:hypothetical protein
MLAVTLCAAAPVSALEQAPRSDAARLLGADAQGDNWTVGQAVLSDGFSGYSASTLPMARFRSMACAA